MSIQGWLTICLFAAYFIYTSIENARRYKEQKAIAKEENEKSRQALKNAFREIIKEIKEDN